MKLNIDNISLPKITCGKDIGQHRELFYSSRIIKTYGDILLHNSSAQDVLRIISEDSRVKALENTGLLLKMARVSRSDLDNDADKYKHTWFPNTVPEQLSIWFLWRAGEVGLNIANDEFNEFLNTDTVEVLESLWLFGSPINVPLVKFDDGIELRPVRLMPESNEREAYARMNYDMGGRSRGDGFQRLLLPFEEMAPTCALVRRIIVSKLPAKFSPSTSEFVKSNLLKTKYSLKDVALMLNLLEGVAIYPSWQKRYVEPSTPFGPMTHTGSGLGVQRVVLGTRRGSISSNDASLVNQLLESYRKLSNYSKDLLVLSITRFRDAKFKPYFGAWLDLSISLESTLLAGHFKTSRRAKRFRNLGCRLLGEEPDENNLVWQQLYNLYDIGSRTRHEGMITSDRLDHMRFIKTQEELNEFLSPKNFTRLSALTGKILQALILSDKSPLKSLMLAPPRRH